MLRKDVKQGQCFRYVTERIEAYYLPKYDEGERILIIPALGWYVGVKVLMHCRTEAKVELLEHYSTHPKPTPLVVVVVKETEEQKLIKSFKVAVPLPQSIDPDKTCESLAANAAMKMNNNDWKKDVIVPLAGKLSKEESDAWSIMLRLKVAEQEKKDKAAAKDKEIKVALEFDYWE